MKIDCISDLHGYYPKLNGGDLLLIAGDLTKRDQPQEHIEFSEWLDVQPYTKKIVVAGNHDNNIDADLIECLKGCYYLNDSPVRIGELKIWGSPWTRTFEGMNPHCKAFTVDTEEELLEKWKAIPLDTNILITHSPPYGLRDLTVDGRRVGSKSLQMEALRLKHLKIWVVGHIHEDYGMEFDGHLYDCSLVNASHVNEKYQPVNAPISIEL